MTTFTNPTEVHVPNGYSHSALVPAGTELVFLSGQVGVRPDGSTPPTLEEQARIISLLDKFDTLTSSITEGLPREIELRQKQYEYYRDLLLSFPKSHSDEAA